MYAVDKVVKQNEEILGFVYNFRLMYIFIMKIFLLSLLITSIALIRAYS